jgi:hypothetical protein
MEMTPPFLITLGPLLYYWPRHTVQAFYREVAASAVDVVYLGETVCLRRHVMRPADWLDIAAELSAAGKQVVLSTPTLVESGGAGTRFRPDTPRPPRWRPPRGKTPARCAGASSTAAGPG